MASEWPWILDGSKYLPMGLKCCNDLLCDQLFSKYKSCRKSENSEMHWMTSKWHGTPFKRTSNVLSKVLTPQAPIMVRFILLPTISKIQGCQTSGKSEMHNFTQDWPWKLNSQSTLYIYTPSTYHRAQNLVRFALWSAISKMQDCRKWKKKSEMHRMTSVWHELLHCQKYNA